MDYHNVANGKAYGHTLYTIGLTNTTHPHQLTQTIRSYYCDGRFPSFNDIPRFLLDPIRKNKE